MTGATGFCYFAYGSNMETAPMAERCPQAILLEIAVLSGYRFLINRIGDATVVPDPAASVHGVLWRISHADELALDQYEELSLGLYDKTQTTVRSGAGVLRTAMIYLARDAQPGRPTLPYMQGILRAAREHGFPEAYLRELQQWMPGH